MPSFKFELRTLLLLMVAASGLLALAVQFPHLLVFVPFLWLWYGFVREMRPGIVVGVFVGLCAVLMWITARLVIQG